MNTTCEQYQILISGHLDGELTGEQQRSLEEHLQGCPGCRRDYEDLKRLAVGTVRALVPPEPPPEVWDDFLDNVYNRLERRTGWGFLIAGLVLLAAYGIVMFVMEPWASALLKTLVAAPVLGLAVLFVSVLRQRLQAARNDRYSKEVRR